MAKKLNLSGHESEFYRLLGRFIASREMAQSTVNNYHVLAGALMRFERQRHPGKWHSPADFTTADIEDFISFYCNEPSLTTSRNRRRSHNTVCSIMKCMRTFFNWCRTNDIIPSSPFDTLQSFPTERYASPFFLTVDERDRIAAFDFSAMADLTVQRDIFIFQCLTGCRVSDLVALRNDNISDGYLEYIAQKTATGNPTVIRMPLHPRAIEIIARYHSGDPHAPILPFISPQRYNYAIKQMLTLCGITRSVSILCPYTGAPIRRPINEVAASHIARRTFIGNLYRKIKDPNLISSMTGHVENSRAFNRYRTIDDDIKREIIMLL